MSHPSTAEQLRALFDPTELEALAKAKELLSQIPCDPPKLPEQSNGKQERFL